MIRKISREIVQFAVCVGVCVCTNVLVHNCFAAKFEKKKFDCGSYKTVSCKP